MEDQQPNEVRLARKGASGVPVVRPVRGTQIRRGSYLGRGGRGGRGYRPMLLSGAPPIAKRRREDDHRDAVLPQHSPSSSKKSKSRPLLEEFTIEIPVECRKGAPGSSFKRRDWITYQRSRFSSEGHRMAYWHFSGNNATFYVEKDAIPKVPYEPSWNTAVVKKEPL
ncbi:hypothetical protein SERLADRAFT_460743, partial [Serpula lacrymans var. lacrymans S7.9]